MTIKHKPLLYFLSFLFIAAMGLTSCMKDLQEDEKLPTYPIPEGVKIGSAELGPTYLNQVFYSLETNKTVKNYSLYDFDLAFESTPGGWHILLNSSRFMHAGNSGTTDFQAVTSQSGISMNFDNSNGNLDSTAIGNWTKISATDTVSFGHVYVIDLGLDEVANPLGYKKIVFDSLAQGKYYCRFANLNGSDEFTFAIPKMPDVSFIGFTFANGGAVVDYEPASTTFDLFIGQYTTLLYSGTEPYPYLVRGVLLNRNSTQAFLYPGEKQFTDIEFEDIAGMEFSPDLDAIGHEWKYYNLEEGFYSVKPEMVFIILNQNGFYYKLHFIGYYNEEGQTGYPKFEFKKLK